MPLAGGGPMLKLAVLGDGGVGKTALVIQLCLNKFVETYDPTIEDSYRTRIVLDEHAVTLELMDTAGQEEYISLRDQWISEGEGFLIVYSVTNQQSFTRIKQYYQEISRIKDEEPYGVVLVGNKIDESSREVSRQQGEALASRWGIPFFETSAKKNINTEDAFLALARLTHDNRTNAIVAGGADSPDPHGYQHGYQLGHPHGNSHGNSFSQSQELSRPQTPPVRTTYSPPPEFNGAFLAPGSDVPGSGMPGSGAAAMPRGGFNSAPQPQQQPQQQLPSSWSSQQQQQQQQQPPSSKGGGKNRDEKRKKRRSKCAVM